MPRTKRRADGEPASDGSSVDGDPAPGTDLSGSVFTPSDYSGRLQALSDAVAPWLEGASIFDMVEVFKVMGEAHALDRADAVRLALEVLLSSHCSEVRIQPAARRIMLDAETHGVEALYRLLEEEELESAAANIFQVYRNVSIHPSIHPSIHENIK